jgi:uncharacterized damage-inducible protein DinB
MFLEFDRGMPEIHRMNEAARIADQHRRAFDGSAWHGPAVFEVLAGVDATRAAAKPIKAAHSVWELVLHIRAWEEAVRGRIQGRPIDLSPEQDWPAVTDTSPGAWEHALTAMRETHDALNREIADLADERLEDQTAGKEYTLYLLLHGVVQHALYHAGQIALLKKG